MQRPSEPREPKRGASLLRGFSRERRGSEAQGAPAPVPPDPEPGRGLAGGVPACPPLPGFARPHPGLGLGLGTEFPAVVASRRRYSRDPDPGEKRP